MNTFNRIVAIVLWALLVAIVGIAAVAPLATIAWLQEALNQAEAWLRAQQEANVSNFLIGQIAVCVSALRVLEIEAAPDVDVPMKTDEVVEVTRDLIEQDMGLKLGRLDVHMRYAPMDPEWAG